MQFFVTPEHVRYLRRFLVRIRTSSLTIPFLLLIFWTFIVFCLSKVADSWIVILAISPLLFAALITILCVWAYRRDFYA